MNLPTSREQTAGGATPVSSVVLNAVQDCIIGAKHAPLTIPIGASDWKAEGGGATYGTAAGKWTWGGFDDITVALRLPIGTRITGARFNYNRTAGTLNFKIQKMLANAGAWTDIATGSDAALAGAQVKTLACTETVVADTQYRLYIDSSGVATSDVTSFTIDRL
jgi:hypothetical protein